jgi:hypothetical protein
MKVNITVVATKTFMAGLEPAEVAILKINTRTANSTQTLKIAQGGPGAIPSQANRSRLRA